MEDERQRELPLPFPELSGDLPLLPARMINEYEYCPRLAYLEWVQGEWAESADTVEGRYSHRRVDRPSGDLPSPENTDEEERIHARSITLSSNRLGLVAKLDLIEGEGKVVFRSITSAASGRMSRRAPIRPSWCRYVCRRCCWRSTVTRARRV